jgi:hypothetical protein
MRKRSRPDASESEEEEGLKPKGKPGSEPSIGQQTSYIKNKEARSELYSKLKHKQQKKKRMERKKRQQAHDQAVKEGLEPPPKQIPKVIGELCSGFDNVPPGRLMHDIPDLP